MKEVTYKDQEHDRETLNKISDLRHERWAIFTIISTHKSRHGGPIFNEKQMNQFDRRLYEVQKELFELTGNMIYDVR